MDREKSTLKMRKKRKENMRKKREWGLEKLSCHEVYLFTYFQK